MTAPATAPNGLIDVDPANRAAFDAWNGPDGEFWATHADTLDASLARYRDAFVRASRIRASDRVLDIGCGNGQSTIDAAGLATRGFVLGVDLSAPMLAVARRRAAARRLTNVDFLRADAQIHPFDAASFDAAISHTGAMFFADPVAGFTNIARSLRSGAPLTLLAWQSPSANDWFRDITQELAPRSEIPTPLPGTPGPFSLADPDYAGSLLESTGFTGIAVESLRGLMWFGDTREDAFGLITSLGAFSAMLRNLEPGARATAHAELRASINSHHTVGGVQYPSAMWLITATRA